MSSTYHRRLFIFLASSFNEEEEEKMAMCFNENGTIEVNTKKTILQDISDFSHYIIHRRIAKRQRKCYDECIENIDATTLVIDIGMIHF